MVRDVALSLVIKKQDSKISRQVRRHMRAKVFCHHWEKKGERLRMATQYSVHWMLWSSVRHPEARDF